MERGARDVLDALHQLDQHVVVGRLYRRKADAAIAHDDGGDAVPAGGTHDRIPGDLAVVMRVHIDPTGRDHGAVRRDLPLRRTRVAAHRRDHPAVDRNIARIGIRPRPIDDGGTLDHQIMHRATLPIRHLHAANRTTEATYVPTEPV